MEAGDPFDVAILDMTIPGAMGGKEAVKGLRALDPAAKAIAMTGYSEEFFSSGYRDIGFRGFIRKPYGVGELSQVVYDVIRKD